MVVSDHCPAKHPLAKQPVTFGAELSGDSLTALIAELKRQNIPGLSLGSMQISDTDMGKLSTVSGLQILLLDQSDIEDTTLAKVKAFRGLKMLSLQGSHLTENALKVIKDFKTLSRLHLTGKSITNKELENIRDASGLTWLRLDDVGQISTASSICTASST